MLWPLQLTGDFKGMLRVADYAAKFHGAFPVWMGPTDAFLMAVHPATVRSVLSGTGKSYVVNRPGLYRRTDRTANRERLKQRQKQQKTRGPGATSLTWVI
jgi:hypothetical protein